MTLKPCIQCGNDCEILPVQLGDLFTLTFLRICSAECMFMEAYDFLYSIGYHKSFRAKLHDKQNEEDAAERKVYVDQVTEESLKMMREYLTCPLPVPSFRSNLNTVSLPYLLPVKSTKLFGCLQPQDLIRLYLKKKEPTGTISPHSH